MPVLDFKGKQFVYAHHLTVPFRQLTVDAGKSAPAKGAKPGLDDNLIIHGDNLHALKALLPKYAGRIKCIYIDPPYNTGTEGWCYNDKVNSPLMQEWLKKEANPVDKEDLERHDKWLAMMWPRLQLLRELLADDGAIFVSIDENEINNLITIANEIFNVEKPFASFVWKRRSGANDSKELISTDHEYVVCYRKTDLFKFNGYTKDFSNYKNPDKDPRGEWTSGDLTCNKTKDERANLFYSITDPETGKIYEANPMRVWAYEPERMLKLIEEKRVIFPKSSNGTPQLKRFRNDVKSDIKPVSTWIESSTISKQQITDEQESASVAILQSDLNSQGTKDLREVFEDQVFNYPKPIQLIKELINQASVNEDIILDSFAGSGTTAHAVLALNKEDGGNRKFILVECEDYADKVTAERVRRVIKGVPGAKDAALKDGLGGSFTYCELGEDISIENLLKGNNLPSFDELAAYAFYTATGQTLAKVQHGADYLIGETDKYRVHLVYKPDLEFMRGNESALNMPLAKSIAKAREDSKKTALVFASQKFMGQKELTEMGIVFCQLPYALHRIVGA